MHRADPPGRGPGGDQAFRLARLQQQVSREERNHACEGERRRRGENRLSTDEPRTGNSGAPFPFGTVEKQWVVKAGLAWNFQLDLPAPVTGKAALEAAFHDIDNLGNVAGRSERVRELRFALTLRGAALRYAPGS